MPRTPRNKGDVRPSAGEQLHIVESPARRLIDMHIGADDRPQDAITAAITTAVVMVVAAVSPQHAWQQPILRFAGTVIGVAVGIAAWIGLRVIDPRMERANQPDRAPSLRWRSAGRHPVQRSDGQPHR